MQLDLSGRVVLVTGAARGIGAAIADAFRAEGCTVVRLDLASDGFPADPDLDLVCDVRDGEATRAVAADVERRFGRIDVLVNNAGILAEGLLESMDDDAWDRSFDVNVGGVFRMCKAVIPAMKRQRVGPHHQRGVVRRDRPVGRQRCVRREQGRGRAAHAGARRRAGPVRHHRRTPTRPAWCRRR